MDRNIYNTDISRFNFGKPQFESLTKFLLKERHRVIVPDNIVKSNILDRSPLTKTVISDFFQRIVDLKKYDRLLFLNIPSDIKDVPEVATYTHLTLDVLQLQDVEAGYYRALSSSPFKDKILLNITSWMTRDNKLINIQGLHTIVLRDLLTRSYYMQKGTWINPSVTKLTAKFYGMIVANIIGRMYHLSFQEKGSLAAIYTAYFMYQCTEPKDFFSFFQSNERDLNLQKSDIEQVSKVIQEHLKKRDTLTIKDVCEIAKNVNPSKMRSFSFKVLSTKIKGWDLNVYTSHMGLEYPPYFLYLLFSTSSGRKSSLSFELKKLYLDKDVRLFCHDVLKSDVLFLNM